MKIERTPIHRLAPHQVEQLTAARQQVILAQQRFAEMVLLLVGPESVRDPTLEVDLDNKVISILRPIVEEDNDADLEPEK